MRRSNKQEKQRSIQLVWEREREIINNKLIDNAYEWMNEKTI